MNSAVLTSQPAHASLSGGEPNWVSPTAESRLRDRETAAKMVEARLAPLATAVLVGVLANVDAASAWPALKSPTALNEDGRDYPSHMGGAESFQLTALDEVQSLVRGFAKLADGWGEPGTIAPNEKTIDDALVVLQNWPDEFHIPEPVVGPDGSIALELYDSEGFTLGGIELLGNHYAVFTVLSGSEVVAKGDFDSTSTTEVVRAIEAMCNALA